MKRKTPLLVLIVLALFLVLQSVVIVHAYEYKVVTQFGSVVSVYETPGPHLKIPFIQSTQSIPKKKMLYDLSPSDVTTKDKKVMNVDSFIIWEVTDPVRYMSALNASQEKAETRIGNVVYNSLKPSFPPHPRRISSPDATESWPRPSPPTSEARWIPTASASSRWRRKSWTCRIPTRSRFTSE